MKFLLFLRRVLYVAAIALACVIALPALVGLLVTLLGVALVVLIALALPPWR